MTPVTTANTAASGGKPPIFSAMPIAMGVVTDFGASDSSVAGVAPSTAAIASTDTTAVAAPTHSAHAIGSASRRTLGHSRASGTASATTAGPSRKCTNCAPSKYVWYDVWVAIRTSAIASTATGTGLASGWNARRAYSAIRELDTPPAST